MRVFALIFTRALAALFIAAVCAAAAAQQPRDRENPGIGQDPRLGEGQIAPVLEEVPRDQEALESLRAEVLGNPLFAGTLVARDSSATALLVSLDRMSDTELIAKKIDEKIMEAAATEAGDLDVWIAGAPSSEGVHEQSARE